MPLTFDDNSAIDKFNRCKHQAVLLEKEVTNDGGIDEPSSEHSPGEGLTPFLRSIDRPPRSRSGLRWSRAPRP